MSSFLHAIARAYPDPCPVDELIEELGLGPARNARISRLSLGTKRRVDIAAALVGNPLFLVLDEPNLALDVSGQKILWRVLEGRRSAGATILYTTHGLVDTFRAHRIFQIESSRLRELSNPGPDAGSLVRFAFSAPVDSQLAEDVIGASVRDCGLWMEAVVRPGDQTILERLLRWAARSALVLTMYQLLAPVGAEAPTTANHQAGS